MLSQLDRPADEDLDDVAITEYGYRPDYGSGPHLDLLTEAVKLARQDMSDPLYSADAREFLTGDLCALFAECLGTDRSFLDG